MNEPTPETATALKKHSLKVVYIPPTEEQVERYARRVCRRLDEQQKADKPDSETREGFTEFMKLVVKIESKHRNPGGNHE